MLCIEIVTWKIDFYHCGWLVCFNIIEWSNYFQILLQLYLCFTFLVFFVCFWSIANSIVVFISDLWQSSVFAWLMSWDKDLPQNCVSTLLLQSPQTRLAPGYYLTEKQTTKIKANFRVKLENTWVSFTQQHCYN